jgi:hypothetical protein
MRVLLDPELRYRYDLLPYAAAGLPPLADPRRAEARDRWLKWVKSQVLLASGGDREVEERMADDLGLDPDDGGALSILDRTIQRQHHDDAGQEGPLAGGPSGYGYYVLGVEPDDARASEWMRLALQAAWEEGVEVRLAVGICGGEIDRHHEVVDGVHVLLAVEPTRLAATEAIRELVADGWRRTPDESPDEYPTRHQENPA